MLPEPALIVVLLVVLVLPRVTACAAAPVAIFTVLAEAEDPTLMVPDPKKSKLGLVAALPKEMFSNPLVVLILK